MSSTSHSGSATRPSPPGEPHRADTEPKQLSVRNPLQVDIAVTSSELIQGHEKLKGKTLLLDLTMLNSCGLTYVEQEAKRPGGLPTGALQ